MKNTLLLFTALAIGFQANAQTTLSQNVDPLTIDVHGLACWVPATNEYKDNSNARVYNLNEFGVVGDFVISAVEFGQFQANDGKNLKVIIYTSDSEHLTTATLTQITEVAIALDDANDNSIVTVPISASIPAGSIVVVETFAQDEGTATDLKFFPGFNFNGENDFSWVKVPFCGASVWRITEEFQTNQQYLINIVGTELLGVNDIALDNVSVYPNPTTGKIIIDLVKSYSEINVVVTNMLGQQINSSVFNNDTIIDLDIQGESGIYFVSVTTSEGKTRVLKIVKK